MAASKKKQWEGYRIYWYRIQMIQYQLKEQAIKYNFKKRER